MPLLAGQLPPKDSATEFWGDSCPYPHLRGVGSRFSKGPWLPLLPPGQVVMLLSKEVDSCPAHGSVWLLAQDKQSGTRGGWATTPLDRERGQQEGPPNQTRTWSGAGLLGSHLTCPCTLCPRPSCGLHCQPVSQEGAPLGSSVVGARAAPLRVTHAASRTQEPCPSGRRAACIRGRGGQRISENTARRAKGRTRRHHRSRREMGVPERGCCEQSTIKVILIKEFWG